MSNKDINKVMFVQEEKNNSNNKINMRLLKYKAEKFIKENEYTSDINIHDITYGIRMFFDYLKNDDADLMEVERKIEQLEKEREQIIKNNGLRLDI